MRLVVDTNIIISALIKDSFTRWVLLYSGFDFFYPEISFEEIKKYKKLILKKSCMKESNLNKLLSLIFQRIRIVPTKFFRNYLNKANKVMRKIDINDSVFLALAFALDSEIWSDDKDFEKQSKIKTIKTKDLAKMFFREKV